MTDSERLIALINENGFTELKQFASHINMPYKTFYNVVKRSKRVSNTSHDNFKAIANGLGMDSDTLYDLLYKED